MIVDDQNAVSNFLSAPSSYGIEEEVEVVETHISKVFLAGDRAFKLKRAVNLPYVDFSTVALRMDACSKEVAFNSPAAPGLYCGVRKIIKKPDGQLVFGDGDEGEFIDVVVEMVRFDQDTLFDRMADNAGLTPDLMTQTARRIARFHDGAPVIANEGGAANIAGVLDINEAGYATSNVFSDAELKPFHKAFRDGLARHASLLDQRSGEGKLRRCHGDLHLRNICMFNGEPVLFDCIEFNDKIAVVDVLYDLAFLLMDLWHRGFPDLANLVANRYLDETNNEDGFALLPYFMALRASVRAHVTATLVEEGGHDPEGLKRQARDFFNLALALLEEKPPKLVAIGGYSGSGKSTIAAEIAPKLGSAPGARIIESDRIRKRMFKVDAETRLDQAAYGEDVSKDVYRRMAEASCALTRAGGSVVANAVFNDPAKRAAFAKEVTAGTVPLAGFWLEANAGILEQRITDRFGGASDATVDVLKSQMQSGAGDMEWQKVDAARQPAAVAADIIAFTNRR